MRVTLKVLASTAIKRRKPWSRLAWIGRDQEELFLLGNRRLSILYLKSGKTKRKIAKLSGVIKDCIALNYTNNGWYLVGLLSSGDLFIWHKDTSVLMQIDGPRDSKLISPAAEKWLSKVYASEDASKILITIYGASSTEVYLWQCDSCVNWFCDEKQRQESSSGRWWHFPIGVKKSPLRLPRFSKNICIDACFVKDELLGDCCLVVFIYAYCSSIHFDVLNVNFFSNTRVPAYRWYHITLPLHQLFSAVGTVKNKGAIVTRWSHNGQLLATAIHLENSDCDKVAFLSSICEVLFISTLPKECSGPRSLHRVCDLAWTHDDLFVVTINHMGSICLLSRLGEPLAFSIEGCSMDLSTALSLNIHPYIFVSQKLVDGNSNSITADVLKQRFSVCCHPRHPVFLCSDGYIVTCLQLPHDLSDPLRFVGISVEQVSKNLSVFRKLLRLSGESLNSTENSALLTSLRCKFSILVNKFDTCNKLAISINKNTVTEAAECESESDSSHLQSEKVLHHYSVFGEHESGSVVFGTQNLDRRTSVQHKNLSFQTLVCDIKREAKARLLCVWGVLVTVGDTWTKEYDKLMKESSHLLVRLCGTLLSTSSGDSLEMPCILPSFLETVLLINSWLSLCRFIVTSKSMLLIIWNTLQHLLKKMQKFVVRLPPDLQCIHFTSLYHLLKSTEKTIIMGFSVYARLPTCISVLGDSSLAYDTSSCCMCQPYQNASDSKFLKQKFFLSMWQRFYETISEKYVYSSKKNGLNYVMGLIQQRLQQLNDPLCAKKLCRKIGKAELITLTTPEYCNRAVDIWMEKVQKPLSKTDSQAVFKSAHILHRILYTLLGGYHLKEAVSFIYWLLTQDRQNNNVESSLCHTAIRQTMKTFASFLSSYLLGQELCVYPLGRPRELPFPHGHHHCTKHRLIFLSQTKLMKGLKAEGVVHHWTADVAATLFLSSGYVNEAARLAHSLGDWKTAYVLFYAAKIMAPSPVAEGKALGMLQSLLLRHLQAFIDSNHMSVITASKEHQSATTLKDWLLAGALCDVDAMPFILQHLITKLHSLLQQLPLIVPTEVDLPYPPPYCFQQNRLSQARESLSTEEALRKDISEIIQVFVVILRTAHCTVLCARNYLSYLHVTLSQMAHANITRPWNWPLMDLLDKFQCSQDSASKFIQEKLTKYFREFCGICWFLHARDQMNISLRKFWQQLTKSSKTAPQAKFCLDCLKWATYLIPFAESVHWKNNVYHLILSMLLEGPRDRRASCFLARCFPEMTTIPLELDHRVCHLLNIWRGTLIKLPSNRRCPRATKRLSVIHLEQCKDLKTHLDNLTGMLGEFEKIDFGGSCPKNAEDPHWKIRPYEVDDDFLSFLGLVVEVTVVKDNIDLEEVGSPSVPLVMEFKRELLQYLNFPMLSLSQSKDKSKYAVNQIFVDAMALRKAEIKITRENEILKPRLLRSLSLSELGMVEKDHRRSEKATIRVAKSRYSLASKLNYRVKSLTNIDFSRCGSSETGETLQKRSSLSSVCDAINVEDFENNLASSGTDRQELIKVFAWLVRWAQQDHFTGGRIKTAHIPQMKISLTLNQVLSAMHSVRPFSQQKEALTESTSDNDKNSKTFASSKSDFKFSKRLLSVTKRKAQQISDAVIINCLTLSDTSKNGRVDSHLNGELQVLQTFGENQQESSKDSSLDVSSLSSDSSSGNMDDDHWSKSFVPSASERLTATSTTSKWTNTGHNYEMPKKRPFAIKSALGTLHVSGIGHSSCKLEEIVTIPCPQLFPIHNSSPQAECKDFACGSALVFGHNVSDAGNQVQEVSLLENVTAADRVPETPRGNKMQNDDISVAIKSLLPPPPVVERRSHSPSLGSSSKRHGHYEENQHQFSFKRLPFVMPEIDAKEELNALEDVRHIRLLRLPAEKDHYTPPVLSDQESSIPPQIPPRIPALLSLDQEPHCFYAPKQANNKKDVCPKFLTLKEISDIQTRWKPAVDRSVSKNNSEEFVQQNESVNIPPLLHLNVQPELVHLRRPMGFRWPPAQNLVQPKQSTDLHHSGKSQQSVMKSNSCQTIFTVQKDAAVITEYTQVQSVAISTEVRAKEFASISTNTVPLKESCTPEDLNGSALSPTKPFQGEQLPSMQNSVSEMAVQTVMSRKTQKLQRNAGTNTDLVPDSNAPKMDVELSFTSMSHLKHKEGASSVTVCLEKEETTSASVKQDLFVRYNATKKEASDLHSEVLDIKKMLNRLENLEKEGLLDKLFPSEHEKRFDQMLPCSTFSGSGKRLSENWDRRQQVSQFLNKGQQMKKVNLLAWMKQQKRKQHQCFVTRQEGLRQAERQPFISDHPSITNRELQRAEEERNERQKNMCSDHYKLRKKEIVHLMHEMSYEEGHRALPKYTGEKNPVVTTPCTLHPTPKDGSSSYVCAPSVVSPLNKSLRSKSHRASPSRKRLLSRHLSCPTSPKSTAYRQSKVKPTTYVERLQVLQPSSNITRNVADVHQKLHIGRKPSRPPVAISQAVGSSLSRSSSCETLSAWIVPEKIKLLLYGGDDDMMRTVACDHNQDINETSSIDDVDWEQELED